MKVQNIKNLLPEKKSLHCAIEDCLLCSGRSQWNAYRERIAPKELVLDVEKLGRYIWHKFGIWTLDESMKIAKDLVEELSQADGIIKVQE